MKQAFYNKEGVVPHQVGEPGCGKGSIKVYVEYSCISAGTEMAAVKNSKKSLIKRVMENREKYIPKAIELLKLRGIKAALKVTEGSMSRNFGSPLGYTAAGTVCEVGSNAEEFKIGQRVAIMGAGFANHAAVDSIPVNLAAPIPDNVSFEEASTVAVGCIAMQGVRRLEPVVGEKIVVMGLGILGLLAVQMLKSMGCYVIGIDLNPNRMALASELGCDEVVNGSQSNLLQTVMLITNGNGADGVLFTAATHSSVPMSNCFKMLRRKGRFVLVGVSGMEIDRADIYPKEIDFRISTSYGAGRYDENYESAGKDYPVELVRWTEKRNMIEYLNMISEQKINVRKMINGIYDIDDVKEAYNALNGKNPPLIVLIKYSDKDRQNKNRYENENNRKSKNPSAVGYAIIGAGSFARSMHLPNLSELPDKFYLKAVMSRTGSSAAMLADLYGAEYSTTDYEEILNDKDIELVMICTRHNDHAALAIKALKAGKAVFTEKPAAITYEQLDELIKTVNETGKPYMVGFNRRFSEFADELRRVTKGRTEPLNITYTMNAGYLPLNHWTHNFMSGGGRIVGEGCHIVDMITSVVGSTVKSITVNALRDDSGYYSPYDNICTTIFYEDGSVATMQYIANGCSGYPKETMRVYYDGSCIVMNDYKTLTCEGKPRKIKKINFKAPVKGHKEELKALYAAVKTDSKYPIPVEVIRQTTQITLDIREKTIKAASLTL